MKEYIGEESSSDCHSGLHKIGKFLGCYMCDAHQQAILNNSAKMKTFPLSQCSVVPTLVNITFCGNQITELPAAFFHTFTHLSNLNLEGNLLRSLPQGIGKLTKLKHLNLSNNKLTHLPGDFNGCRHTLLKLDLASNYLTSLPSSIGEFKKLIRLDLNNNLITSLPESIYQLRSLITLKLAGHQLHELPSTFGQLSQLKVLDLSGLPILTDINETSVLHKDNMRATLARKEGNQPINGYDNDVSIFSSSSNQ